MPASQLFSYIPSDGVEGRDTTPHHTFHSHGDGKYFQPDHGYLSVMTTCEVKSKLLVRRDCTQSDTEPQEVHTSTSDCTSEITVLPLIDVLMRARSNKCRHNEPQQFMQQIINGYLIYQNIISLP